MPLREAKPDSGITVAKQYATYRRTAVSFFENRAGGFPPHFFRLPLAPGRILW